jgi:16S rRNA (cytosine967-C5)-methyltransferase
VYATCSLLAEENGGVVEAFLAAHPDFAPLAAADTLARQDVRLAGAGQTSVGDALRLLPNTHGSDGFFALAMERR